MAIWEDFEVECTTYLNSIYGAYANFTHKGGTDSTIPDIYVETSHGSFYIEAKHSPAQCGQFVLLPNISTSTFEYSPQNVNHINIYAKKIMEHMNKSFDEFRDAGTTGKDITMPGGQDIFANWVIDTYKEKGTRFFITNNQTILPIEHFKEFFEISAKYRIKRSGSSSVGKTRIPAVIDLLTHNYVVESTRIDDDKLFVFSRESYHNKRFILRGYEYMFSLRGHEYEIRKLSNTYNANVIFSISLKPRKCGMSHKEFISILNGRK